MVGSTLSSGNEHILRYVKAANQLHYHVKVTHYYLSLMIQEIDDDAVAVGGLTLGADPLVCGIAPYESILLW